MTSTLPISQSYISILIGQNVVGYPRILYRLALSLARRWPVEIIGRPIPTLSVEGPLSREIDMTVLNQLVQTPPLPPALVLNPLPEPWLYHYLRVLSYLRNWVIATEPLGVAFMRLRRRRSWIWDMYEDYGTNLREDPAYRWRLRTVRYLLWLVAKGASPTGYILAEYAYAGLSPMAQSRFLPNAFVPVENAPPLLPGLVRSYDLITGNLTESWGLWDALEEALEKPTTPLVIAGSIKTKVEAERLRGYLSQHRAWLWLRSYFVPYPVVQNLQRHAALLYGLYQPRPHIRDKIPGKFYEAAALGVPLRWRKGVSPVWDAFWKRYENEPTAPMLYWSYYEPLLLEWVEELMGQGA